MNLIKCSLGLLAFVFAFACSEGQNSLTGSSPIGGSGSGQFSTLATGPHSANPGTGTNPGADNQNSCGSEKPRVWENHSVDGISKFEITKNGSANVIGYGFWVVALRPGRPVVFGPVNTTGPNDLNYSTGKVFPAGDYELHGAPRRRGCVSEYGTEGVVGFSGAGKPDNPVPVALLQPGWPAWPGNQ